MTPNEENELRRIQEAYRATGDHVTRINVGGTLKGRPARSIARLYSIAKLAGLGFEELLSFVLKQGLATLEVESGLNIECLPDYLQDTIHEFDLEFRGYETLLHILKSVKKVNTDCQNCGECDFGQDFGFDDLPDRGSFGDLQ